MTARDEALRRLQRIEEEGAYAGLLGSSEAVLDARDARFATELVSGVTRWRRWLDFLISQFFRGDSTSLDPILKNILRIGIYELILLNAPPHAAVNEAAESAKRHVKRGAAGLANGLLRNVDRARRNLPEPDTGDLDRDLAIRHSHPTWMVRRWIDRWGKDETLSLLHWNNCRPVYGLRVNMARMTPEEFRRRLDELDVEWEASPFTEDFVRVNSLQAVFRAGMIRDGLCVVQDEGAGLVVHVLDPKAGERLADACAAPGGKALYAASRMDGRGEVVAVDLNEARAQLVNETAGRLGFGNVSVLSGDARQLEHFAGDRFDRVLLDAPCSGLGVLNKRADLRWRRTREQLDELIQLQTELLDGCADAVRPGGLLVYSTCSIEPEENEHQVQSFLSRRDNFQVEDARPFVPAELVDENGFYRSLPHVHGIDGAFAARLRRAP